MTPPTRKTAQMLNAVVFLLIFWAVFPPRYYVGMVIVLAILPWVAIRLKMRFPDIYRLEWRRKDPNPNISKFFIVPGVILMLRAYNDYAILGWVALLAVMVLIAAAINIAVYKADSAEEPAAIFTFSRIWLAFLLLPYCYGLAVQANALLDIWPVHEHEVTVLGKYDWHTHWSVRIEPWGDVHSIKNIPVSKAVYDTVNKGERACVRQHTGALFISWYDVGICTVK